MHSQSARRLAVIELPFFLVSYSQNSNNSHANEIVSHVLPSYWPETTRNKITKNQNSKESTRRQP